MRMNELILEALTERRKHLIDAQKGLRENGFGWVADNVQTEVDQITEEIDLLESGDAPDLGVFNPDGP